jgi:transcriptional regulator with XRE-family HTH domain
MESIRIARKQRDMTLAQVAERTGLSVSFLSDLERGRTDPSLSSLRRLAACYGVKAASLLEEEEAPSMYYIEVVTRFNLQLEGIAYFQNIHEIAQTQGFQIFTMDVAPEHINEAERILVSEQENLNIVAYGYGIKK